MAGPTFKRVIVKLSGEALGGGSGFGIDQPTVDRIAKDLVDAHRAGTTVGVVVGGGNILRGVDASRGGLSRPTADAMGMLGTVVNALVLEAAVTRAGVEARTMTALAMPQVCETFERGRALRHLQEKRIVIFAGGTGNPFFTTDTTAVLRAGEMGCGAVLKATNVDGVYSADPKKNAKAVWIKELTHQEAIDRRLKVMDQTAFALAREVGMPIIISSIADKGSITKVLKGKAKASIVRPSSQ
jgi:uridylate kinase